MKKVPKTAYVVYILKCADNTLYVGSTNDLKRRLYQHNNLKSGAHYTKIRRPVVLLYSENFKTLGKARRRETEIKGWRKNKKLELIENAKLGKLVPLGTEVSRPNVQN